MTLVGCGVLGSRQLEQEAWLFDPDKQPSSSRRQHFGRMSCCVLTAQLVRCVCCHLCCVLQIAEKYPAEFEARKKDKLRYR